MTRRSKSKAFLVLIWMLNIWMEWLCLICTVIRASEVLDYYSWGNSHMQKNIHPSCRFLLKSFILAERVKIVSFHPKVNKICKLRGWKWASILAHANFFFLNCKNINKGGVNLICWWGWKKAHLESHFWRVAPMYEKIAIMTCSRRHKSVFLP